MSRFEITSLVFLSITLTALPALGWAFMMYQALGATGSVLAAI
jgi:hypothetical protein